ncbi:MAG: FtsX-like permease family protein, partial [Gammaproteobacteria bacterium]|nr:FtsX-like permease family protein [Gammaproteobacteria bacterium]
LRINGRLHTLTLGGVLSSTDGAASGAMENLLVTDISTAQELLGMVGRLSRIDLIVPDGDPGDRWLDQIRQILPPGVRLVGAALQTSMMRQISSAFSLNLSMLSLLALVVGAFLIYNTMTFSVVRRRTMLGTLRTLGVTRGELFHLVLWEALLVGAAGTLFGIMLGIVMADGFLVLITRTINDLYYVLTVREVTISSPALFKAAVLGLGTAVAA